MQDPYSILGVSRDASDEDIKKAYRKLSRIYHPDANINNPNKDQAEAKFKEIQQAYQQIMKEKEMGASGYTGTGSGGYGDAGSGYGGFGGFGHLPTCHSAVSTVSIPIRISRQPRQKKIFICVPPPII